MSGSTVDEPPVLPDVGPGGARVGRTVSPRLIGRADEMDQAVVALTRLPAVVVIEGEAGIGKTRLLAELRSRPELAEVRFVTGACRRIRDPFPLGAVVDALRKQADKIHADRLTPVAGALRPLLPELDDLLPPQPEPLDDRIAERHRVFRGLVEVLHGLAPMALVVEDLHWADEQTVDFVRYLIDDPPSGLAMLLTYRSEESTVDVRGLTSKLPASTSRAHLVLEPLDVAETGALGAAILDADRLTEEFAAKLCERSSGVPFAIEELLALLRARGTLVRRDDGWARRNIDELEVPVGIRDSVLERASRLPEHARTVLEAAAVLQTPVPLRVLVEVCPVPRNLVTGGLETALASGLLTDRDTTIGFRHVLAAQAVYEHLTLPRRVELHSRAATALQHVGPVPLGQLAHHLHHAGRNEEWAVVAEQAAEQAVELGHEDEAVRLLRDVLDEAPLEPQHRGRLAVKLGRAGVEAVRSVGSTDLLADALEPDLEPVVRGELRLLLGRLLARAGVDPDRRQQLYAQAVDELDSRPDLKALAIVGLAMPTTSDSSLTERKARLNEALDLLARIDDPLAEAFMLGNIALVLMWIGDSQWREVTERLLTQTSHTPRHRLEIDAYWTVGMEACYSGYYDTADRLLTDAVEGAAESEGRLLMLRARSGIALLDYCRGCWDGLTARLDALIDGVSDDTPAGLDVETVASCLALAHGDPEAWRLLRDVAERAERLGASDLAPLPTGALARFAAVTKDAELTATAWRLMRRFESRDVWGPGMRALPGVAQAMVAVGRSVEAGALVERWAAKLTLLDAPLATPVLRHAIGTVDAAQQHWAAAAEHFAAAAKFYEALTCPYEAAQVLEQAAHCRFEIDDSRAAETLLTAISAYEKLGASWDLGRGAGLARVHGVRLPGRHRGGSRGYGHQLSPREREVAELAATGRSNQDIADHLYLSISTVKKHLAAAMRKLGVSTRAALAHLLSDGGHQGNDFENGPFGP